MRLLPKSNHRIKEFTLICIVLLSCSILGGTLSKSYIIKACGCLYGVSDDDDDDDDDLPSFIVRERNRKKLEELLVCMVSRIMDESCAICLKEFELKEEIRVLPICKHVFHRGCVDEWLIDNWSCPICRDTAIAQSV